MGDLAAMKEKKNVLSETSSFKVQEAYKNLRTNVQFSFADTGCHVIGVTSAERNEGKSTTTINLAISFAQLGKKVVVIDGDLRLPTVATKLDIPAVPGLSNFLIGERAFKEVCKVDREHGMYVITSGNIPPEPTRLLQSDKMKQLIEEFKKRVDYIFIDLPPVTVVSDAKMLSDLIDGYLLVVQRAASKHKKVEEMVASLKMSNANIIGFVATKSDKTGSKYYKAYRKAYKKSGYYGAYENAYEKATKGEK